MVRPAPKTPDVRAALRAERDRVAAVKQQQREDAARRKADATEAARRATEAEVVAHNAKLAAKAEADDAAMVAAWTIDAKAIWADNTEARGNWKDDEAGFVAAYIEQQRTPVEAAKHVYDGPMIALKSARVHYVKAANGILCNGDALATICGAHTREQTVKALIIALKLPGNPYMALNPGQQSMNLRNRARHAIKAGTLTMAEVNAAFEAK
jgi:hypothetical protein